MQNSYARRVSSKDTVRQRSIESSGAVLKRTMPELVVSKQKLRQAEGIALVRSKREEGSQVLAFSSRPFVMCGLPVRKPPAGQLPFERRNGAFLLQITGHPEFGLPYGQDRLVPIYLATLAIQQQSQTVRFRSGSEMLDTFGMSKGGKEYRRLVQAFERILGATIFFGSDRVKGTVKVVQRSRFNFLREARIWYHRDADQTALSEDFENTIVLSDDFYNEIASHPIPTDLEAVKILAGAPAVLELFMWLSTAATSRNGRNGSRFSDHLGWRSNWVQWNIHVHANFASSSNNGSIPSGCYGRNAPRASQQMARHSQSMPDRL